ncbi:hypothetical protein GCM10009744_32550 [Kribbella alba]|uniref:CsbD-like domain-containing protein n=2 Tax=Kribbella alba TaxID=190197 RepID=A0ABN2FC87_9ACTN
MRRAGHRSLVRSGTTQEEAMGIGDKIKNAAESAKGETKEKVGDATDNEDLQAEGQGEKSVADLKQAGEKVKDAFKD